MAAPKVGEGYNALIVTLPVAGYRGRDFTRGREKYQEALIFSITTPVSPPE